MDKAIEMFKDETQLVQAESAYDMAMKLQRSTLRPHLFTSDKRGVAYAQ